MPQQLTLDGFGKHSKLLHSMGYAKLFSSITESSLWSEPKEVRLLFVTMLAKADSTGFVEAAALGLARVANLSLPEVESALIALESPDPHSKNPDNEGRRIMRVPGGWMVLNYEQYRNRQSETERREYMKEYMRKRRARKQDVNSVNKCKESPSASACVSVSSGEVPEGLQTPEFAAAWESYLQHRIEKKKPVTPTSRKQQLSKLSQMGPQRAVGALLHSISNGWIGIFEPDTNNGRNQKHPAESNRNIGTSNEGKSTQYKGVGKVR